MKISGHFFCGIFFLLLVFTSSILCAQTTEVKLQIRELAFNEDIIGINRILNENTFLEPEYILKVLTENLQKAERRNNKKELAFTYFSLGNFWLTQASNVRAYDYYLQAEAICKEIDFQELIGALLMNKAASAPQIDEKIEMYQEAIKALTRTNQTLDIARVHLNLGDVYTDYWLSLMSDSLDTGTKPQNIEFFKESAFKHYSEVELLNQTLNNITIEGILILHYAEWYQHEKKYDEAKRFLKKADSLLEIGNNPKGQTYSHLLLADINWKQNNYEEALEWLKTVEANANKYKYNDYLVGVYELRVNIYIALGNLEEALKNQKHYTESIISINELKSQDKIHAMNLEYNLKQNEFVIEKYQTEQKLNNTLIIIVLFVLASVITISYLMNQNQKRKIDSIAKGKQLSELEKISIEMKLKNKQLEEDLLKEKIKFSQEHLIHFANQVDKLENFLEEVKESLKKVNKLTDNQDIINSLKLSFLEILNGQNYLKLLSSFTSQLNQDFFFYIRNNYENISEDDEQLLAFILLNISSKDIGKLLNISPESIYTKRYRLRKKLNFDNDESFLDFYNKLVDKLGR
jgi:DNA-binding CsgD family transcriptional regulator